MTQNTGLRRERELYSITLLGINSEIVYSTSKHNYAHVSLQKTVFTTFGLSHVL